MNNEINCKLLYSYYYVFYHKIAGPEQKSLGGGDSKI